MFFSSLFPCFPQVNLFSIFLTLTHFAGSDTSALGRMECKRSGSLGRNGRTREPGALYRLFRCKWYGVLMMFTIDLRICRCKAGNEQDRGGGTQVNFVDAESVRQQVLRDYWANLKKHWKTFIEFLETAHSKELGSEVGRGGRGRNEIENFVNSGCLLICGIWWMWWIGLLDFAWSQRWNLWSIPYSYWPNCRILGSSWWLMPLRHLSSLFAGGLTFT